MSATSSGAMLNQNKWPDDTWMVYTNMAALQLVQGDIGKALESFTQKTGQIAKRVRLNPKYEAKPLDDLPDSIEVEYCKHVLFWEVWVGGLPEVKAVQKIEPRQLALEEAQ